MTQLRRSTYGLYIRERREGREGSGNGAQGGGIDGRGNGYGPDKPMAHRASCHGAPTTPPDPAAPAAHMCEAPTGACLVARRGEMNGGVARQPKGRGVRS